MVKGGVLFCLLMMAMDVVAGILGIEAEMAQNKVKHLKVLIFECRDPSHQAFKLGLVAALLLVLAHLLANLIGGCICMRPRQNSAKESSANKQLAMTFFILSWIIVAVAFSMLIMGTLANSKSRKSCGLWHHRVFYIGGILCLIHGLFIVAYYVSVKAAEKEDKLTPERAAAA